MDTSISEELTRFVAEQLSIASTKLGAETRLLQDLGVDGADGIEFMREFSRRFNVDLSDFCAARHFGPEAGPNPLLWLWWLISGRKLRFAPVTLRDLQVSIENGRWTDNAAEVV